jgi:cysteinyl-tRNA synthetase
MAPPNASFPAMTNPRYSNGTEAQEKDLKSSLIKMIEAFKDDLNKVLKEIQENPFKQVEALNEERYKYKETQEKYNQTGEYMNKTVQPLKIEMEAIKNTQTEAILEMDNLGKRTGTIEARITNRMQEMEENLNVKDMIRNQFIRQRK